MRIAATPSDSLLILAVAGAAAVASPIGGVLALWRKPTSLFMSFALGYASGVLLATISFEMLPQALELSSIAVSVAGFAAGFVAVYAFDLSFTGAGSRTRRPSNMKKWRAFTATLLGFLFAMGGGGMFYLTVTDLVPDVRSVTTSSPPALRSGPAL